MSGNEIEFVEAAQNGDIHKVKRFLETKQVYVNCRGDKNDRALNVASDNGHVEIAKLLIENGADINIKGTKGWTSLHSATANGSIEIVKFLIRTLDGFAFGCFMGSL